MQNRHSTCPGLSDLPGAPKDRVGWPWTEWRPPLPEKALHDLSVARITIVTPSYNQAQFIEETIRSVLLQGYPGLEYIVMDGGSTDGSAEIIRRYEPWLSYVHIGPDGGQAAAIADGFRKASGDILAWLNSDDRYLPGALVRVARFFVAHPRAVFGNADVNLIDAEGCVIKRYYAVRPNGFLTSNLGSHGWAQPGCFWRRESYEQVGGVDPSLCYCMDRDLFIRLVRVGPGRRIPGPPVADFRAHDQAKSSTPSILEAGRAESDALIKKYGTPRLRAGRRLLRFLWWLWVSPATLRIRLNRRYGWEW